jgi:hypothetical protein
MNSSPQSKSVAIVGAGPGGIVAARYLLEHGFQPVLFEQSSRLGGQWNQGALHSGIWPGMRTNTGRVTTQFSDMGWPAGTKMFLRHEEVLAYLERYAAKFGITDRIRTRYQVERVERADDGWAITVRTPDGSAVRKTFARVIVAAGRYSLPRVPPLAGLESFSGAGGVTHTFHFRDAYKYRDQRVLVAGCAISAVEIAPEVAMAGAARVTSCMRRQRYVLQRIVAGVPIDSLLFTRYFTLAKERLPLDAVRNNLKEFIVRTSGTPQQWGALPADDDPLVAGITQAQFYLPLVAEGKITQKPWIRSIEGQRVTFEDDTADDFDAVLLATGFKLNLPFLSPAISETVGADGPCLRLYRHTFHPLLPDLAFLGLFHQAGPYLPPLELQARWIAYTWAGLCRQPGEGEMSKEIAAQELSEIPLRMNDTCIAFARDAGVEPDPAQWRELRRALLFGPLAPVSFRLTGPDALPDAAQQFTAEAAQFRAVPSPEFSSEQRAQLQALEGAYAVPG